MTVGNRYGESHGRAHIRQWATSGLRVWLPDYLREAERSQGYPLGQTVAPASWHEAEDISRWPEQHLPALLVQCPGLASGGGPSRSGDDGQYFARWALAITMILRGVTYDDRHALADVWELAVRLLMLQQAATFAEQTAYTGPEIWPETVEWADSGIDDLPQRGGQSRTLVAVTATFRVGMTDLGSDMAGPTAPSLDPLTDPGPWTDVSDVSVTVEHHPEGVQ